MFISPKGFLPNSYVYGILNPEPLVQYLKLTRKIAFARVANGALSFSPTRPQFFSNTQSEINALRTLVQQRFPQDKGKGDFVAYYRSPDRPGLHMGLLVNDAWGITCHTTSRCGSEPINDVGHPRFIYCRVKDYKEQVL